MGARGERTVTGAARRVWSYGLPVYLPAALFGVGQGAIIPAIPFAVRELGGSVAAAGFVFAVMGVGRVAGTLPAGRLVERIGERRAMIAAVVVAVIALVVCLVAPSVVVLALGVGLVGVTAAVFGLARHSYLTQVVPYSLRARALSTLGGANRIGMFLGPFLGAAAIGSLGVDGAYWVHIASAILAVVALMTLPDVTSGQRRASSTPAPSTLAIVRRHSAVLGTTGLGVLVLGAVRATRPVVITLWADHLGLDAATASLILGVSGAVDMVLFYPAGWVMDRFGRRWTALPCLIGLGVAHVLIPLTTSAASLTSVAVLMGIGNGIGSGIVMTLGSDASPDVGRAVFLGAWRLLGDLGSSAGPFVLGGVAALAGLGAASVTVGLIATAVAVPMSAWLRPRMTTLRRESRAVRVLRTAYRTGLPP